MTIITHVTRDRAAQLHSQCRGWRGPISAAVFMPLVADEETLARLRALTRRQALTTARPAGLAAASVAAAVATEGGSGGNVAAAAAAEPGVQLGGHGGGVLPVGDDAGGEGVFGSELVVGSFLSEALADKVRVWVLCAGVGAVCAGDGECVHAYTWRGGGRGLALLLADSTAAGARLWPRSWRRTAGTVGGLGRATASGPILQFRSGLVASRCGGTDQPLAARL